MPYLILAIIAAVGFTASLICHLLALMHIEPPLGHSVFLLHIGIFVVWIPLVVGANKTKSNGRGNLDHLTKELPIWVKTGLAVVFFYAIANFIYFMYLTSLYPKHQVPFLVELRGFSGHWMVFYGIAWAGMVALSRVAKKKHKG